MTMQPAPNPVSPGHGPRFRQRGFTLFESILAIALLALASVGIMNMQPQIFKTQTTARDEYVGLELMQACAEKLLAQRRSSGYGSVNNTLCSSIAATSGFGSPSVQLYDAAGTLIGNGVACSAAASAPNCRAVISIAKTSGPAATLPALTLRLSNY